MEPRLRTRRAEDVKRPPVDHRLDFPAHLGPDVASLAAAGAIFYRRLMSGDPFDPALVPDLVDTVLGRQRP